MGENGGHAASAEPQPDEVMLTLQPDDAGAVAHRALRRIGGLSGYYRAMLSPSRTDRILDYQSKRLLLWFRELEPVSESRGYGAELPRLRAMALSTIRPVTQTRWKARNRAIRLGAVMVAVMFPVLAGATVLGWSWWLGFDDRGAVGLIGLWLLTMVGIVLVEGLMTLALLSLISNRLAWSCVAAVLAVSVWFTARQVVSHHDTTMSWLDQFLLIYASLPVLAALSIVLPVGLMVAELQRLADIDCLQALFVDLLDTAHLSAGLVAGRPAEPDSNPMAGRVYDRDPLLRSLARTGASAVT